MNEINEGKVVITGTGQAGTYIGGTKDQAAVLLRNGDIWYGNSGQMRLPQNQADLDAAIIDIDKFKGR